MFYILNIIFDIFSILYCILKKSLLNFTQNGFVPKQGGKVPILAPTKKPELEKAKAKVEDLDLSKIHLNLQDEDEGPGWSPGKCQEVEVRYRAMLVGHILYPFTVFAPDRDVDVFWHYHILDTRAYIADCNTLFGEYLHHDPYLGMEGAASEAALEQAWSATRGLFEELGVADKMLTTSARCGKESKPAICGTGGLQASICGLGGNEDS